ncbi:MAG: N-acetyl sugar amidotransferase [Pseudomonadales bacterium]|nr:N-acetyl sugar amidotransferase [Pseudomonadales bacterium]
MSEQVCTRCVMDTTDPSITFDAAGVCSHCHTFDSEIAPGWFPNEDGLRKLEATIARIKEAGRGNEYDCILGLSGGLDSSYLAYKIRDYGLKPLVVHVDAGWNSELAVYNIEQIVKYCGYELYTRVMNWDEIRDLQVAFLRSGIANLDVVQDHAFFSSLYHFAVQNNIRYVISGGNVASESVFPSSWHHSHMDAINIRDIHKRFGEGKLRDYKTISFFQYFFYYPFVRKMNVVRPLNFMPYNLNDALQELVDVVGYKVYGRKHGESRFTKFFQNHYLPVKFGYDKRKAHYSSLVLSGQMTREQACERLAEPLYDPVELEEDIEYVAKKLRISVDELKQLTAAEGLPYSAYKNWDSRYQALSKLKRFLESLSGKRIRTYS